MRAFLSRIYQSRKIRPVLGYYGLWVSLTYLSVISAVIGVGFAFQGDWKYSLVCLVISGMCDSFDGRIARLNKKRNERAIHYGIQIDALADLISFGALPAAIGYALMRETGGINALNAVIFAIYVLAALIRLAYFNVMETEVMGKKEKRVYYEGLPTTSAALIITFVYCICDIFNYSFASIYPVLLAVISIAFVLRFKIPKPRGISMAVLCLIAAPVVIYILLSSLGWI